MRHYMFEKKRTLFSNFIILSLLALILSSCGGGKGNESEPKDDTSQSYTLVGEAVKGALVNADVKIYQTDPLQADLMGGLISTGTTDSKAKISNVKLNEPLSGVYLVLVTANNDTVDLSTGKPPFFTELKGLITSNQLISGQSISITPLTTMAIELAKNKLVENASVDDFFESVKVSSVEIISKFGFGLEKDIDIFSNPALLNGSENLDIKNVVQYRTAIEAVAAVVGLLAQYTKSSPDEILLALALDISDGKLDGKNHDEELTAFANIEDFSNLLNTSTIALLPIPNSNKSSDIDIVIPFTVDEVEQMLVKEAELLESEIDASSLKSGEIKITPVPFSSDTDNDSIPDLADPDIDNDGTLNENDAFPYDKDEQLDSDGDGIGNNKDTDDDNDDVDDELDVFPLDENESADMDNDGIGDNSDMDIDGDTVANELDAFPLNASESQDTDQDGVGDNSDSFPRDSACNKGADGNEQGCYLSQLAGTDISEIFSDSDGVIYIFINDWNTILRFDTAEKSFMEPIEVENVDAITTIAWSESNDRIYLGHQNGVITYIDLADEFKEKSFSSISQSVNGLAVVGNYILAQDDSGAWETHSIFDKNGILITKRDWNYFSREYAWNSANDRVYFFQDDTYPNDLRYEEINQSTGQITNEGETPYHGDYLISPPIRISQDGALVLLGSGDVYRANNLTWQGSLGLGLNDALWTQDGGIIVLMTMGDKTMLRRYDATFRVVEQRNFTGVPIRLLATADGYLVISNTSASLVFTSYQPTDDSDGDGVTNLTDAFPLDLAASLDSDNDGYPDSWNEGFTAADSSSGLSLDSYPQDSACYLPEHGDGTYCDYASTMPVFTPDKVEIAGNNDVFLLSTTNNRVYRWSAVTTSYTNPIYVGTTGVISASSPIRMTYSAQHERLYFGYASGAITYVDLNGDLKEQVFVNLPRGIGELLAVGNYLLVQEGSGGWKAQYLYDVDGTVTDTNDAYYAAESFTWNAELNRVYFISDYYRLQYLEINQASGQFGTSGGIWNWDNELQSPIVISQNGEQILLGNGNIFDSLNLTLQGSLNSQFINALWDGITITSMSESLSNSKFNIWSANSYGALSEFTLIGSPVAILPYDMDAILILNTPTGLSISIQALGDHDGDGLPAWWETLYNLSDSDVADSANDNDFDGLTNLQEFGINTNPILADTDNDGLSDGDEISRYQTLPLIADTDNDGLLDGDEVNTHGTNPLAIDSDNDGLSDYAELNEYGSNPLSTDSDSDGMSDDWEVANMLNPILDDALADADGDTLNNIDELTQGTDPNVADTDHDGLSDGEEVNIQSTNPLVADSDGDRMQDGWEVINSFNPLLATDGNEDADGDGFVNMVEYFLQSSPFDSTSIPIAPNWVTTQGNASHNGFVPLILDVKNFGLRWIASPFAGRLLNPVVAAEGKVFVSEESYYGGNQSMAAVNAVDGALIWKKEYGNINNIQPPAYNNGKVYFIAGGFLRALSSSDGSLILKADFNNIGLNYSNSILTPFNESIYLNADRYSGGVYGIDGNSGDQQLFVRLNQNNQWTPSVDNKFIYAYTNTYDSAQLSVINRTSGLIEYSIIDSDNNGYSWSSSQSPVIGTNNNVIVIDDGKLTNFDLQSRSIGWQRTANFSGQPALALGQIFSINAGALNVVDEVSGKTQWLWEPPGGGELKGEIVVTINMVFVQDTTKTYAIDLNTHQPVWSYPATGHLALSNEDALYIALENGSLVSINIGGDEDNDGIPTWWENAFGMDDNDARDALLDKDIDGLANLQEYENGTNPDVFDTDNDGLSDGDEVNVYLTQPKVLDTDADGLNDGEEVLTILTDPLVWDTDLDGFSDGEEINRYKTDPNDPLSKPDAIADYFESFENAVIPGGWVVAENSNADWILDPTMSFDGSKSLKSGSISDSQQSTIMFTGLFVSGTFSFYSLIDSESCCDTLSFYIDGVKIHTFYGNADWSIYETILETGRHTLEWQYTKDGSVSRGADSAWIDNVSFIAN